ncbi:MAG: SRPBCC family protein [Longimicrobiales bacterium]
MIRVEIEETIDRPTEEVFERLIDMDRYAEWMPESWFYITSRKDTDGPVKVGTRYTDVTRLGAVRGEVAELERPRRVVFHYVAEGRLQGAFRALRPVIQWIANGERRRTVAALKASLERV